MRVCPQETVSHMVKTVMSTSFIAAFSSVVFNLKSRFLKEKAWEVRGMCVWEVCERDCA